MGSISKEEPMGSKRTSRRDLLKSGGALAGGALAGGLTLGVPVHAQDARPCDGPGLGQRKRLSDDPGQQGVGRLRRALPFRDLGAHTAPDGRQAFTRRVREGVPRGLAAAGFRSATITPSSLHYVATTRQSFIPDIDPKQHTLMIHGLVDRPLTFTMDDLKRFPSVSRLHFLECAGNRHTARQKTVQESHGMTSCSEWTGVLLSTLLKECGLKGSATWFVAEGAEEVKGASSMPIAKAMDDCIIAYGTERRAPAAAARVSVADRRARLRRHFQYEVSAAHQGRRPVLHELQRLRASQGG